MSQHTPVSRTKLLSRKKLTWVSTLAVATLVLTFSWKVLQNTNSEPEIPHTNKSAVLFGKTKLSNEHSHLHHTMKLGQTLNLKIKGNSTPPQNGQEFQLTGVLTSTQKVNRIRLQWSLPPGVALVSGDLEQEVLNITPGNEKTFHITLRSETEKNQQIHLKAEYQAGKTNIGAVAQYNTKDGESIKKANQKLFERQKSYRHNM
jgi:hypothetical protein